MTDQTLGGGQQRAPEPAQPDFSGLPADLVAEYNKSYGGSIDDDYKKALDQRQQQRTLGEIEQYAQSQGLPPQAPQVDEKEDESIFETLKRVGNFNIAQQIATGQKPTGGKPTADKKSGMSVGQMAGHVGADITKGFATESHKMIVGGPLRAAQAALDLGDELATWLNNNVADLRIGDRSEPMQVGDHGVELPNVGGAMDDAETVTGGIGQAITQFLTGFAALPAAGAMRGAVTAKAALTDFTFFDGQEANLANLVQSLGGEGNAIIDYLANDEKTPEIEGRLKSAVTGIVPDIMLEGLVRGLDVMKAKRKAQQLAGTDTFEQAVQKTHTFKDPTAGTPEDMGKRVEQLLNGSPSQDALKIERKLKHVDIEVPEDVLARGLNEGAHNAPPPLPGNVRVYAAIRRDQPKEKALDEGEAQPMEELFGRVGDRGVHDFYTDLSAAKGKIKDAAEKGKELRLVHADVPVDEMPASAMQKPKFRGRIVPEGKAKKPLGAQPPPLPELGEATPQINWSKFDSQDSVLTTISRMAEAFDDDIVKAQRGVQSNAATRKAAGDENAWELLFNERKKDSPLTMTAQEQYALRELWASSGQKLTELATEVQNGGLENMFAFRKMLAIHNTIQQTAMGVRTETARALQQWNMPVGADTDKLKQLQFAVENQEGTTKGLATRIAALAKLNDPVALEKFIRPSAFQRSSALIKEYFINSVLSGPKTHMVNAMSNMAVVQHSILERQIAGAIGDVIDPAEGVRLKEASYMMHGQIEAMKDMFHYTAARIKLAAKTASEFQQIGVERNTTPGTLLKYKPSRDQADELLARQQKAIDGLKDPIVRVGRDKLENQGRTRAFSSEYMDIDPNSPWGVGVDLAGSIINLPGTLLGGADDFFKTINYRAELHATAYRRAALEVDEGLLRPQDLKKRMVDLVDDPPEDLRLGGEEFAAINTFTSEPNKIAKQLMSFRNAVDDFSVRNVGIPVGSIVLPFVNTPANILAYTFDRTPLAPIGKRFREDVAAGGARRNMALARVSLGSAAMMVTYSMALDGHFTGGGPRDKNKVGERRAMRRGGWQPYSVRIKTGEDENGQPQYRYFAYNRMDPIGLYVGIAADMAEYALNTDGRTDQDFTEAFSAAGLGIANNIADKSYMTGIADLVNAIQNPDRYGERYFTRIGGALIPTGVKEVARFNDPVARHTWDMVTTLKNGLPEFKDDLPPRLNFWGDEIKYTSDLGSLYDAMSPIYSSTNKKASDVDRELLRIKYFPSHKKTMRIGSKSVPLRNMPEAFNRWIKLTSATKAMDLLMHNMPELMNNRNKKQYIKKMEMYGHRTLKEAMRDVMFGKATGELQEKAFDYAIGDSKQKEKVIKDIVSHYRAVAKVQTHREFPKIDEILNSMEKRQGDVNPMYQF